MKMEAQLLLVFCLSNAAICRNVGHCWKHDSDWGNVEFQVIFVFEGRHGNYLVLDR